MNTPKNSFGRSSNDALSLPALKGEVSRVKTMMTKTLNQAIFVGLVSVFAFSSAGADDVVKSFEETLSILEEQGVDPVYLELINAKMNVMASDFELRLVRSEYELQYVNMQAEYEIRIAHMQRELDMAKSNENVD